MPSPEEVAAEVNRRSTLLVRLLDTNKRILRKLSVINDKMADRPTRSEAAFQRRLGSLTLFVMIVTTAWITDWHVEDCGPGHRSEAIVSALLDGDIQSQDDLRRIAEKPKPWPCGILYPIHSHSATEDWPNDQNVVGLVLWIVVLTGSALWVLRPKQWAETPVFEEEPEGEERDDVEDDPSA